MQRPAHIAAKQRAQLDELHAYEESLQHTSVRKHKEKQIEEYTPTKVLASNEHISAIGNSLVRFLVFWFSEIRAAAPRAAQRRTKLKEKKPHSKHSATPVAAASASAFEANFESIPFDANFSNAFASMQIDDLPSILERCTANDSNEPPADQVQRAIDFSISNGSVESIFSGLLKRPVNEPMICLKVLLLIDNVLSYGHRSALSHAHARAKIFASLEANWEKLKSQSKKLVISRF